MTMHFSSPGSDAQIDQHAVLLHDAGTCVVRMLDLSKGGAKVDCDQAPVVGSVVMLILPAQRTPARVAWTAGKLTGLQFL